MIFFNQLAGRRVDMKQLKKIAEKAVKIRVLEFGNAEISVAIVDDGTIKELNKNYRGKNQVTDVLSFSYGKKEGGEIVISYETAGRQAKERKHSLMEELKVLLVHGFLHLAGFDHEKSSDKKKMQKMECEILGEGLCERG